MEILRSQITLLIFGILSLYTSVNGQISNRDRLLGEIKEKVHELHLIERNQFEQDFEIYLQAFRETCNKNGGAKAFDIAEKGMEKFGNCLTQIFPPEQRFTPSTSGLDGIINELCPKVKPFENCVEQFSNSISFCLDDKTLKAVNVMTRFVSSVLDYACENNGEHVKTFINDGGVNCSISQQDSILKCLEVLGKKQSEAGKQNTGISQNYSLGPTLEECKSYKEFESCFDDKLKRCNKPSITKIGNHVADLLYEKSGCVEILGSAASPTTVINSLLVITGIAMFL